MEILGLHYAIWIVLVLYFVGMLLMGWWSKRGIRSQEGYLLGNRRSRFKTTYESGSKPYPLGYDRREIVCGLVLTAIGKTR